MPERSSARRSGGEERRPVRARRHDEDEASDRDEMLDADEAEPEDMEADGEEEPEETEPDRDEEPEETEPDRDEEADGRRGGRTAARDRDADRRRAAADGLTAADAARAAVRGIVDLIGKRPEGVTSVRPTEDGWLVGVEVVEDKRVPSSADILALYEAELDPEGSLQSYRRSRQYPRGHGNRDGGS